MADFCTNCSNEMGFHEPDIDVAKEVESIESGYFKEGYLCEGCGLAAIANFDGVVKIAKYNEDQSTLIHWEEYNTL